MKSAAQGSVLFECEVILDKNANPALITHNFNLTFPPLLQLKEDRHTISVFMLLFIWH